MTVLIPAVTAVLLACELGLAGPRKLYDIVLEDVPGGGRVLQVTFYGKLPSPNVVDKIVRESLAHAILVDSSLDILATAFLDDDTLNDNQYSGMLVYRAKQKKVLSLNEDRGVTTTTKPTSTYFVELKEEGTLPGIKPERKWLSLTIVFSKQPSQKVAYDAIFAEIEKVATKGLDVNAYVSVGDKEVRTSWKQMHDRDGAYVFGEYDSNSKKVVRKGKTLKQLP